MSSQPTGEVFGPLGALEGLLMELAFPFLCSWWRFVVGLEQARASCGDGLLWAQLGRKCRLDGGLWEEKAQVGVGLEGHNGRGRLLRAKMVWGVAEYQAIICARLRSLRSIHGPS